MTEVTQVSVCPEVISNITTVFSRIGRISGLDISVWDNSGICASLIGDGITDDSCDTVIVPVEGSIDAVADIHMTFCGTTQAVRGLTVELVQCLVDGAAASRREEALLDELGANWENLENLYELTAEIQGAYNTREMLGRLLARLASANPEIKAGLYIEEGSELEPVAAHNTVLSPITWRRMPALAKMVHARRVAIIDPSIAFESEDLSWSKARSAAIAPVATRNAILGFLIIWSDAEGSPFDSSQLRLLEAIAYQAAVTVERDRLVRAVREADRLQRELEIAGSIHQLLLVSKPPEASSQLEVAAFNLPSQKVDGDFHDYLTFPDGALDVLVGDVMGKGVSAALVGAATKNAFLKAVANLSLKTPEGKPDVARIVTTAASSLYDNLVALERFVTVCYCRFDTRKRHLQFVDCGHTGVALNRKTTGEVRMIRGANMPIGVDKNELYEIVEHSLLPGDTYLFYSDGVTEAHNSAGNLFGEERLSECLESWSSLPPSIVIQKIRAEVMKFIGNTPLTDDFTCVIVKIKSAETDIINSQSAEFRPHLSSLEAARDFLDACLRSLPIGSFDQEIIDGLQLSISELMTNCVIHGKAQAALRVTIDAFLDRIRVEIRYPGRGFDLSNVSLPSFDGSRDGGFGIYIVSRCADEFDHQQFPDGTCSISFSKFFRGNR
jgi:sigma-B regulation protein RsbU (phosphoserine phosphatase)